MNRNYSVNSSSFSRELYSKKYVKNDFKSYSKSQLEIMNIDKKYGVGWISNIDKLNKKSNVKLYATGDYDISSGRIYVALPENLKITREIKTKYNLM